MLLRGDVIPYGTIVSSSNVSGYDVLTGTFIAPVTGVYMFTVYMCARSSCYLTLTKNEDVISKGYFKYHLCDTIQSIVPLTSGDEVCVKCAYSRCKLYENKYIRWNTFSGVLLNSVSDDGR